MHCFKTNKLHFLFNAHAMQYYNNHNSINLSIGFYLIYADFNEKSSFAALEMTLTIFMLCLLSKKIEKKT